MIHCSTDLPYPTVAPLPDLPLVLSLSLPLFITIRFLLPVKTLTGCLSFSLLFPLLSFSPFDRRFVTPNESDTAGTRKGVIERWGDWSLIFPAPFRPLPPQHSVHSLTRSAIHCWFMRIRYEIKIMHWSKDEDAQNFYFELTIILWSLTQIAHRIRGLYSYVKHKMIRRRSISSDQTRTFSLFITRAI